MFSKVKQAIVSALRDDSSSYPEIISSYKGKTQPTVRHSVYGVCSQPPINSLGLLIEVDHSSGVQYGIFDYVTGRFKNLEEGEVQVGNYITRASLKFDKNGDVTLNVPSGDVTVNVVDRVTINGDAHVSGDVTANNFISSGIGVDFNSHIHTDSMGGDTSAPK